MAEYRVDSLDQTIVKIKDFGRGTNFELSIQDIFDNKNLLEKFHPYDVSKIAFIAFGEIMFSLPREERKARFNQLRDKAIKQGEQS